MDVCINSWSFHTAFENGLLSAIDFPNFCRDEFGVRQVEFFDPDFFFGGERVSNIMELSPADPYLAGLKAACVDAGVTVAAISAQNDFTSADDRIWHADIERVLRWIEIAAEMTIPVVRVNSGNSFAPVTAGGPDRLAAALKQVARYAKNRGITLAVENHPQNLASLAEARVLVDIVEDLSAFGVTTCVGNGHIEPSIRAECLNVLFSCASHCHVKFYEFDSSGCETTFDYVEFLALAHAHDFTGALSIELVPPLTPRPIVMCRFNEQLLSLGTETGVPPVVLQKLAPVADDTFVSRHAVEQIIADRLSKHEATLYGSLILDQLQVMDADFESRKNAVTKAVALLVECGVEP